MEIARWDITWKHRIILSIIASAAEYVRTVLEHGSSGHDWWHIYRVAQTAKTIAKQEGADLFVCELAALLHDMADDKLVNNEQEGLGSLRIWLDEHKVDENTSLHLLDIIASTSFNGGSRPPMRILEGQLVQNADRLNSLGAIGISRVFAYSGNKGRKIHDPAAAPRLNMSLEEYRNGKDTAIQHFYEKLLKLQDLMNTDYGKKMAVDRHCFMEQYLERFYEEWEGNV